MSIGELGRIYVDGEPIISQGDTDRCMYVVQAGQVEVVIEDQGGEAVLSVLGPGDVFGEMALFSRSPRSATVRARGEARILTIDARGFLRRVHEDPSLAFRILEKMSERIDRLNREVLRLRRES